MKPISSLPVIFVSYRPMMSILAAGVVSLGCSFLDNEPPSSVPAKDYDLPSGIRTQIFNELPEEIGNVDVFLNKIEQNGMVIHEGNDPPEIYTFSDSRMAINRVGVKFSVDNDCIYDGKITSNNNAVFGKYEEEIMIINSRSQFAASVDYFSLGSPDYPQYPGGYDSGSGVGYASGNENNFTIFIKVENGRLDQIPYQALWIISGTVSNSPNPQVMSDVTKCLVMLGKGSDPGDKVANSGTIRIFKDQFPERLF